MLFPKVALSSTAPEALASTISELGVCGPVFVELSAEWLTYVGKAPPPGGAASAEEEDPKAAAAALTKTAGKWAREHCRSVDCIVGPFPATQRALAAVMLDAGVLRLACVVSTPEEAGALATLADEVPSHRLAAIVRPADASAEAAAAAVAALGPDLIGRLGGIIVDLAGADGATLAGLAPESPAAFAGDGATAAAASAAPASRGSVFSTAGVRGLRQAAKPSAVAVMGVSADAPGVGWAHRVHLDVVAAAATREGSAATAADPTAASGPRGGISPGLCLAMCSRSDRPDGLVTTVVADELGVALGLVYSSAESIAAAVAEGRGVYWSRSRGGLWRKGESSGMIQTLVRCRLDCDSDALLFTVRQAGSPPSFCHLLTRTCWGDDTSIGSLQRILQSRLEAAPAGSYTKRLFEDPELLRAKLLEEAQELSETETPDHAAAETADVIYFAMVAAVARGASLEDVQNHLHWRSRKVKRRPGNSKPERIQAAADFFAAKAASAKTAASEADPTAAAAAAAAAASAAPGKA
ncbi:hypothetical protein FNF29_03398 [Cafeteria roenbergensis]|uniref:Phosphoribosyl-AMP cyclohydrolase domain-containing protein n=1 Tax=Cafeteria roenbergensis TaxID=33653 RepID=A0A5A8CM74_CAFRO|nr:hypothetical protein FNF29_03398 [Cafeteria roenbergensis]|eukprot:KAA0153210.1 hypothetical protein FNF29_03398 [Cafeteria roenbergensis]